MKYDITDEKLFVTVPECSGVRCIKESGNDPTKWHIECTRTVNKVIADMIGLGFELLFYKEATDAAQDCFLLSLTFNYRSTL